MVKNTPTSEDSKKASRNKKSSLETFAINQNISIDEIREKFPALYAELTSNEMSVLIDEVEDETNFFSPWNNERQDLDPFSNYEPNIFDFLARARTNEEGLEIIDFLAKQGQLSAETVKELNEKIKTSGIRSFGPKRSSDYYFRKSEEIRTKKIIQKRYSFPKDDDLKE
ncbi:MAG: DUF2095 family protein [Candidatus Hodarchaeales archaeon]|jgi:hypothetical protein